MSVKKFTLAFFIFFSMTFTTVSTEVYAGGGKGIVSSLLSLADSVVKIGEDILRGAEALLTFALDPEVTVETSPTYINESVDTLMKLTQQVRSGTTSKDSVANLVTVGKNK